MGLKYQEMSQAMREAREIMRVADAYADDMCRMLDGRLRHCSTYALKQIKSQLKNFNSKQGVWKNVSK